MTQRLILPLALAFALPLAACQQGTSDEPAPAEGPTATDEAAAPAPAGLVGEDEKLEFTGTEPFWGGRALGGLLTYTTPENINGSTIAVTRSEANGALTLSGTLDGGPFELVVTKAECSDGMSDRIYPFTAALSVGGEERTGCAWSAENPYQGPVNP